MSFEEELKRQYRAFGLSERAIALGEEGIPVKAPIAAGILTPMHIRDKQQLALGEKYTVVAEKLGISEHTVKTHVRSMLSKTGFSNRTELAIKARALGVAIKLGSEG